MPIHWDIHKQAFVPLTMIANRLALKAFSVFTTGGQVPGPSSKRPACGTGGEDYL
jgi:hypothetical protein